MFYFTDEDFKAYEQSRLVAEQREIRYGYLGKPDGSGGYVYEVSGKKGKYYARIGREDLFTIAEVSLGNVTIDPRLLLVFERVNGELVATRPVPQSARALYGVNAPYASQLPTNGVAGTFSNLVDGRNLVPGALLPSTSGGLYVRVEAYHHRGGYWNGETELELVPPATAFSHCYVVVGINTKTNAITQAPTDEVFEGIDLDPAAISAVIAAYPDVDWRGAVDLTNGDTAVNPLKLINVRGLGETKPLSNYSATAAPTVTDDIDSNYGVGSLWIDTTNDDVYQCVDSTAGAAVWVLLNAPVMTGATDSTDGVSGLVPAPLTGDEKKFFKADGTWSEIVPVSTDDVTNPPTDAELDSAFGTPADAGAGFMALVDDDGADTDVYLVASNGTSWFYTALTKAV